VAGWKQSAHGGVRITQPTRKLIALQIILSSEPVLERATVAEQVVHRYAALRPRPRRQPFREGN
jgi:hypothetical protein